jgi:hypothetical protein
MAFTLLSIAAITGIAMALFHWQVGMRRRNAQSWGSLIERLQPDWDRRAFRAYRLWQDGQVTSSEEKWESIGGARGLWTIYQNARVMMEMADYATRNGGPVDAELLAALRRDALHIRYYVFISLLQYAFNHANESICSHAFHAASAYLEMAVCIRKLLEVNTADMVTGFAGAAL